jgi:hypothetical protein
LCCDEISHKGSASEPWGTGVQTDQMAIFVANLTSVGQPLSRMESAHAHHAPSRFVSFPCDDEHTFGSMFGLRLKFEQWQVDRSLSHLKRTRLVTIINLYIQTVVL